MSEQLILLNPDPDWPGTPARPGGDGWIWVRDEADAVLRFPGLPTLEILADAGDGLRSVHETLALYGPSSTLLGIGGWQTPGRASVLALGRRGGAWVRRVAEPEWCLEAIDD